ncbi:hypothetical protein K1719_023764 [Acacia pycnantha]|nr:hypothetical protein K1719_023764 [Acacia pycnantha]
MNALTGDPWMIYDHYLTVRPWEPQFNPARATIDKVVVWIRLPRVFLEFYDKEALSFIGDRIGEMGITAAHSFHKSTTKARSTKGKKIELKGRDSNAPARGNENQELTVFQPVGGKRVDKRSREQESGKCIAVNAELGVVDEGMSCDGNPIQLDINKGPSSKGLQVCGPSNPIDPSHDPDAPSDKVEGVDSMEVGPLIDSSAVCGSIGADLNNGEVIPETQMS